MITLTLVLKVTFGPPCLCVYPQCGLGKMEHSIELVREKNRAALVSFYQRHNSEKLSEKEEGGTPVIDTILSKASTYTKATAEAYKQKYDAAPELTEPTGDMVTLTAEQARAVWACVAQ